MCNVHISKSKEAKQISTSRYLVIVIKFTQIALSLTKNYFQCTIIRIGICHSVQSTLENEPGARGDAIGAGVLFRPTDAH